MLLALGDPKAFNGSMNNANGTSVENSVNTSINATGGRDSEPAFSATTGMQLDLPAARSAGDVLFCTFHLYLSSTTAAGNIFLLRAGGTTVGGFRRASDLTLEWFSGTSTLRAASVLEMASEEHLMVQVRVKLATTAVGSVLVRVGTLDYIDADEIITVSNAAVTNYRVARTGTSGAAICDVLVAHDDVVSDPDDGCTDFLGNVKTLYREPVEDVQAEFARSAGSDNFALLGTADGDDSYTHSDVDGAKDRFRVSTTGLGARVFGVQSYVRRRKESAGAMGFRSLIRSGAAEVETGTSTPGTSYLTETILSSINPDTGVPWEAGDDLQVGYRLLT